MVEGTNGGRRAAQLMCSVRVQEGRTWEIWKVLIWSN
jgi:hypothetical protein